MLSLSHARVMLIISSLSQCIFCSKIARRASKGSRQGNIKRTSQSQIFKSLAVESLERQNLSRSCGSHVYSCQDRGCPENLVSNPDSSTTIEDNGHLKETPPCLEDGAFTHGKYKGYRSNENLHSSSDGELKIAPVIHTCEGRGLTEGGASCPEAEDSSLEDFLEESEESTEPYTPRIIESSNDGKATISDRHFCPKEEVCEFNNDSSKTTSVNVPLVTISNCPKDAVPSSTDDDSSKCQQLPSSAECADTSYLRESPECCVQVVENAISGHADVSVNSSNNTAACDGKGDRAYVDKDVPSSTGCERDSDVAEVTDYVAPGVRDDSGATTTSQRYGNDFF